MKQTIKTKKGAMFGLDARIALAIFGALSVISGAALYSAIQDAKVVSFVTTLTEIGKSNEAYLLDTGSLLPDDTGLITYAESLNLLENDALVSNWQGPYLTGYVSGVNAEGNWIKDSKGNLVTVAYRAADFNSGFCSSGNCSVFIIYRFDKTDSNTTFLKNVDLKIDAALSSSLGNFKYSITADSLFYTAIYKYSNMQSSLVL